MKTTFAALALSLAASAVLAQQMTQSTALERGGQMGSPDTFTGTVFVKQVMRTGDVVFAPAGVNHWHGATKSTSVTHYAIQAVQDGSAVTWGELVSDEDYGS